jgi:hypothetical protein
LLFSGTVVCALAASWAAQARSSYLAVWSSDKETDDKPGVLNADFLAIIRPAGFHRHPGPHGFPGEKRYPVGTSTSTNVRLTEAEIHAVSMACRTAVGPHR